jgi:UDP-N-acetylglucosamine--N-acetylmuramyl-(pentapeptide) pyrophosphoryl-undecaprenol N-acetylglucosamine transferase
MTTKILVMAAGTGGHVFPALTIARELQQRGAQVAWLGTPQGIENRIVPPTGIPLHFIAVTGLRGSSLWRKLSAPLVLLIALWQALQVVRKVNPDCVLGMGGYVTGPGGIAARLLGKKLVIHEQNAVPGMANKLLFPFAHKVLEAFAGAFKHNTQNKVYYVGNPVRAELLAIDPPAQRWQVPHSPLRWLIVGGSLGAQIFNQVVPKALALLSAEQRPLVKHQCGRGKLHDTLQHYAQAQISVGGDVEVSEFIDNMAAAYAWADVVLCRAGASTLAELSAIGVPAVLVPYPQATDDHQTANARWLQQQQAAMVIPQTQFNADSLKQAIGDLFSNTQQRWQLATNARAVSVRDASERAAHYCLELVHG